ncbi:GNAT superfamily N-acetyltransferase [Sulfitobacter undariae]|uniref:GNAT superfamily N-acetyltransferase n=1 Tax=Sulfitobacter undariae TaxID=1563671 RepID=A0A7W6E7I4_9RHOB|nr:GNAT family N-acetyltransferase [Sulfitobacter undariae]MBB3993178.1 GNAT superfamily N-acetyltransferase [Sulfitobacter undariae]
MSALVHLREVQPQEAAALDAFLAQHPETSMFLRGNLAAHGIGNRDHQHGTTYWINAAGPIEGVIGCSNGGYLMCQAPRADDAFWRAAADVLLGREIGGLTGVPDQVNAWIAALGFSDDAFQVKETEPLYRLKLDQVITPEMAGVQLRAPQMSDHAILVEWFAGYAQDTGFMPSGGTSSDEAATRFIAHEAARVLVQGETLVGMASLNAFVGETVQVGGVYVPPHHRGQGFSGAVVAALLAGLQGQGITTAVLFAASAIAARGYERIGFKHIGSYELAILKSPVLIKRGA